MFVTFQYIGFNHLGLYCILTIEAWLKLNIDFNCRYLELSTAYTLRLVFIVLKIRDEFESFICFSEYTLYIYVYLRMLR